LILVDAPFLLDGGRRRKEKERREKLMERRRFSWGQTRLAGCAMDCSC
jgi:hypothetical protein